MISYEIYNYNGIISVIVYTTSKIYHLHEQLFMIFPYYVNYVHRVNQIMRSYQGASRGKDGIRGIWGLREGVGGC